jgi:HK97 family phage major capsid protein
MEIRELIQRLHDKRLNIRSQQAELMSQVEADLDNDGNGENKAKWEELDKEFVEIGERMDMLLTQQEHDKELDEQRSRFEKVVRDPTVVNDYETQFADKMRNWLKAGLPDYEGYAPKSITVKFRSFGANPARDGTIDLERHDLTKGTATDGAELIPTGFVRTLQEHLIESNGVRRTNAQVFTTSSGENLLVPATTTHGTATLVAEGGAFLENDAQFKQVTMNAYKFGQMVQVSTELIQDSAIDLLSYLGRAAGIAIGTVTGTYNVTGTGTAQPEGIANAPTAGVTGGAGTGLTVSGNSLMDLYHSLVTGYRARAFWVMNDATAAYIRKLRDDTGGSGLGNFLWQPGLQAGQPDSLLGRPVVTDPAVAVMAINAYSIAFGDFSAYFAFRDVNTVTFDRSDDFAFSTGLVSFRSSLRTDSKQLINGASGAVKFYRNGAS